MTDLKDYRVRWEEVKSVMIRTDSPESAMELAMDYFYEKARTEKQECDEPFEDTPVDDEVVYTEEMDIHEEEVPEVSDKAMTAIRCALADLKGALEAYEAGDPNQHDWKSHRITIEELMEVFHLFEDMVDDLDSEEEEDDA